MYLNGSSLTLSGTGTGELFYVEPLTGFLYAGAGVIGPVTPISQLHPHAFIDITPASSSSETACSTTGAVVFEVASSSKCAQDSPFEFLGNTLVFGQALSLLQSVSVGVFELCDKEVSHSVL